MKNMLCSISLVKTNFIKVVTNKVAFMPGCKTKLTLTNEKTKELFS